MNQSLTDGYEVSDPARASESRPRVAFVQACWHKDIVDQGRESFVAELARRGVPGDHVDLFEVPGSLEIPLQAKLLARSGRYAAIVAAGLIINGGVYRHEFVAEAVITGIMRVQLDTEVPIISMVLTPRHFHDHDDHRKFFHDHLNIKGVEAAVACAETLANLDAVRRLDRQA